MRKKYLARLFPVLALLLLTPWPIAYAHDNTNGEADRDMVEITVAGISEAPNIKVFGRATGGVEPGDLFYIDSADSPIDAQVTLYITNTGELSQSFSYMILEVGIYVLNSTGEWESLYAGTDKPAAESFITMREPAVSFTLPGCARYKMTIDGGSYYCNNAGNGDLSPRFYLSVNQ
jgi:hypothetical protein